MLWSKSASSAWAQQTVTAPATCSAEGERSGVCKHDSSHTDTEEIPIDDDAHDWQLTEVGVAPTCTTTGSGTVICSYDESHTKSGAVIPALGHDWKRVVTTIPTILADGEETEICQHDSSHIGNTRTIDKIEEITSSSGISMMRIPAGTFTMGSPTNESNRGNDETQHLVTLTQGFYMGKYEVTQKQWETVMGKTIIEQQALGSTSTNDYGRGDNYPMYFVSWYDALVFCNKLSVMEGLTPAYRIGGSTDPNDWGTVPTSTDNTWNDVTIVADSTGYRLPTEAQWEYACRAGTTTAFNTGATISNDTGWYTDNSGNKTHEVGKKPPNAWGLYDMHGNVSEWCWDWYGTYASGAQTDPVGASSGSNRVFRGGSWGSGGWRVRSALRNYDIPYGRVSSLGFRLLRP